jgi:4-hydroxythreonine-4-phosphate dehydrogenase
MRVKGIIATERISPSIAFINSSIYIWYRTLSHKDRVRLAVPLGDPAGIGPEVLLKSLDPQILAAVDLTIVGDRALLRQHYDRLSTPDLIPFDRLKLHEVPVPSGIEIGQPSPASGETSFRFLETAIQSTLAGQFDGIVTGPIAKSLWAAAGHHYPGQTELLAEMAGVERFGMMFVGRSPHTQWQLRMLLATTHISLQQVSSALNPQMLSRKLDLLVETLDRDFRISEPKIAIAGLNPHSGEGGKLGGEEVEWMMDWLEEQRQNHPQAKLQGLLPPDTMWVAPGQAWFGTGNPPVADGYLALYHDQGLIPVKLMAFDRAVNTTIGLPFVRTSPDHGTAFDIAGRGIADATSMREAILLAATLAGRRA